MRSFGLFILSLCVSSAVFAQDEEPAEPSFAPGFVEQQLVTGLNPSAMTLGPDGRLYIVEKNGRVLIFRDGELLDRPFVDIEVDDFNERGLGGISFHPDFEKNGYFYLYYTAPNVGRNRIVRMRSNGDAAVPDSEELLFELDRLPASVHNGGAMVWLPDTTLLVAVGEGGASELAGDKNSLLGKMLRINPDGSIPPDNPYYDELEGDLRAIYALGFRNSFTMAAQPSTGRVFANDVGGSDFEEVNEILPGRHYGWPLVEGPKGFENAPPDYRAPLHFYDHATGCAVIGAAFYETINPSFPPEYHGKYLFADYCRGFIRVLNPTTGEVEGELAEDLARPIALAVDSLGDLYYIARPGIGDGSTDDNSGTESGGLFRIRYLSTGAPVVSRAPEDVLLPRGEEAVFDGLGSGQPTLRYQWLRDGRVLPGDTGVQLRVADVTLADSGATFRLIVANDAGADTSRPATLAVTSNTRPVATIELPADTRTYAGGDTIRFAGKASDAEEGDLPDERLHWKVEFHHDDHTHPGIELAGQAGGELAVPRVGEVSPNVFYRVTLTVRDSGGLDQSSFVDVQPRLTDLNFQTQPEGLSLNADGFNNEAPFSLESVVGLERVVKAEQVQQRGDTLYILEGWDGALPEETTVSYAVPPEGRSFRARYRALPAGAGTGLRGKYYEGTLGERGRLLHERIDEQVQFDWDSISPAPGIVPEDQFSVVWNGSLEPYLDGIHYFWLAGDDGFRLSIDGELVIDAYKPQGTTLVLGEIELEAGKRVPIEVEYFEGTGLASLKLDWDHEKFRRQPVPRTQLYPSVALGEVDEDGIGVYAPNPFHASALVWLQAPEYGSSAEVSLVDITGRVHLRTTVEDLGPEWTARTLPATTLANGVYSLRVRVGDRVRQRKVIVAR